ncbi:MAG: FtsQ-type POTRA domain-containing protein [Verrucomicrobia bacterium]|nr:MAG: FtsQ-type POTRA domain-containing protein [Verrucomicrobiota bacterium]
MWFRRRKYSNRRIGRRYVLDVKLRSDHVRATRVRVGAMVFGVLFGTVFGLYVLWRVGEWTLEKVVYKNRSFAIQKIEVQTDGVIAAEQLRRWSGVKPGDNLFALDLARVKRDLELVSSVNTVSVERVLPRTLRLRVTEREPCAQVTVARKNARGVMEPVVFQLDPDGYVMLPLDPRQRATPPNEAEAQLPVVIGVSIPDLQPNRRLETPQIQAALKLIASFASSPMAGLVDLRQIDVSAAEIIVVKTGQGGEITFALDDFDRQLRRWRQVYDLGLRMRRNIATLDLAVTNNIPARWLEASAAPVNPARPVKPLRTRRQHV